MGKNLVGTESAILNRESSDSESCDLNRAMPRSLKALIGCDSDGDCESIFRDSTRFDSFFASRCGISGDSWPAILRAARVQNETAPEKLLNRYEKRFEKREKGSEKRSEKCLASVRPLKNISPALFN